MNHMKHWRIGNPIYTGAIQTDIPLQPTLDQLSGKLILTAQKKSLATLESEAPTITLSYNLAPADMVYGLGQNLGGINKRGRTYTSYCTDDPHHTEDKTALYGAHNLIVIVGNTAELIYIDFPGAVTFDVGFTHPSQLTITVHGDSTDLYTMSAKSASQCFQAFRQMIGKPYMPPKWAFGYFQSRWGYKCQQDLLDVQKQFGDNQIPLEGIYVDIDYMERFKDFTVDTEKYPDFKGLVGRFKQNHQYLIPIIDAGVKIEKGYPVYEEGLQGDHFVMDPTGKPYVAAVWPGRVHFPDFLRPETRAWFGDWYRFLIDQGIEGIWNDMNEPAIFYDEVGLASAIDKAIESKDKNLDINSYFQLGDAFKGLSNQEAYYKRMHHQYEGQVVSNHAVHNLYGSYMTQSAFEGFAKHLPNRRPLILSRASHTGMHKYGGIWTGDNSSWWSHLALNIRMMPSLSMMGFLYSGADTGGFGGHASAELLSRWLQFSLFTPLLRNHAALGTRAQEPYEFTAEATAINKQLISIRYRLLPFIYSEFLKAYHQDELLFKPLSLIFSGERAAQIEDQIMLGDSVMLVPVIAPNQRGRLVHLPEPMDLVCLTETGESITSYSAGDVYIPYPISGVQFFLRQGHMVPIVPTALNSAGLSKSNISWLGALDHGVQNGGTLAYTWFDDDGITQDGLMVGAQYEHCQVEINPDGGVILKVSASEHFDQTPNLVSCRGSEHHLVTANSPKRGLKITDGWRN